MLLEFRVRNFRSFADESVLSFVASPDAHLLQQNTMATSLNTPARAVTSSVIYGANASGKSNLLRALLLMRGVVLESAALKPEQAFNVQPFRLDQLSANTPTLFEITLVLGGVRYQYGFELTPNRIVAEWLLVYKTAKPQKWFDRTYDAKSNKEEFYLGNHLTGQRNLWKDSTRPNALFLSTAIQLNSEQLLPLYHWFKDNLVVFLDGGLLSPAFSTKMIESTDGQTSIVSMMAAADIAIAKIDAIPRKTMLREIKFDLQTGMTSADEPRETEQLEPRFQHRGQDTTAEFAYEDESQGTQKLFSLAGPLLDILKKGSLLAIDELDRSLHPLLVRKIVETFQDPEVNRHGAQLVFTTHDTSLLDQTLLRRDQIWLTEKTAHQSSRLVPLTEFSPRKGEALERGYLTGRYGGVPILGEHLVPEARTRG